MWMHKYIPLRNIYIFFKWLKCYDLKKKDAIIKVLPYMIYFIIFTQTSFDEFGYTTVIYTIESNCILKNIKIRSLPIGSHRFWKVDIKVKNFINS